MIMRGPRNRFVIVVLAVGQIRLRMIRNIVRPTRIPLMPRTRATRVLQAEGTERVNELLDRYRHAKGLLAGGAINVARRFGHFGVLTPTGFIQSPLPLFATMITVGR